jgi:hypothetical protein
MKQEKSLSVSFYIFKTLILSSLLVLLLAINLQAEPETESKKPPDQPYAYLFPAKHKKLTQQLQREDIEVSELREDIELNVEVYHIDKILRDKKQPKEGRAFRLSAEHRQETKRFKAGTILVKTEQKQGDKLKASSESLSGG